jgi:hypothetical protein
MGQLPGKIPKLLSLSQKAVYGHTRDQHRSQARYGKRTASYNNAFYYYLSMQFNVMPRTSVFLYRIISLPQRSYLSSPLATISDINNTRQKKLAPRIATYSIPAHQRVAIRDELDRVNIGFMSSKGLNSLPRADIPKGFTR